MILPAHLLGPSDQPHLDREAEAQAEWWGWPVVSTLVWTVGLIDGWAVFVLIGLGLWRVWEAWG